MARILRFLFCDSLASGILGFGFLGRISATSQSALITFDVPLGKRLVIESITIRALVTTGSTQQVEGTIASVNGDSSIDIPLQYQGTSGANDVFRAAVPLKIRVDGTSFTNEISFGYTRTGGGISTLRATIFGYLVDIPQ